MTVRLRFDHEAFAKQTNLLQTTVIGLTLTTVESKHFNLQQTKYGSSHIGQITDYMRHFVMV
jgi:hypothetical protein